MKNISKTYIIALAIIGLVIGISQFLVQNSISDNIDESTIINISGRQRMLSQKISKTVLAMANASSELDFSKSKSELSAALGLLEQSHKALQNKESDILIGKVDNTKKILELFDKLNPKFDLIYNSGNVIRTFESVQEMDSESARSNINQILDNEAEFLKLMNAITFEYDNAASAKIKNLSFTEYILFGIAIILLFLVGLLIFRPAVKRLDEYNNRIFQLEQTAKEEALSDKKYLTDQAEIIFANVQQGIFLLDEQFIIDSFYSKETEKIFDEDSLSETNFMSLMKPKLMQRDQEALDLFVEHLFNADIREEVVNKLNPVTQVEIFNDVDNTNIENRYIGFTFSRIIKDDKIYKILVTVLDETENVLMQKKIADSEKRNKKESEQLLSVLNVNPKVLDEYLVSTIDSLEGISKKYENSAGAGYDELLGYTFTTVHSAKGNASLINLKLIEEKLHSVENTIADLKMKEDIEGKNFLKVIYEVTEVLSILKNMKGMLVKIADAYNQFGKENETSGNELLISTLTKGTEKLSKELGKPIIFSFEENNLQIPDEYKLDIKDMSIQLIRNSLIHGIEFSDDRQFVGKTPEGNIRINLNETEDGQFEFVYQDDGAGLDIDTIVSKAIERNLISEEKSKSMSELEKAQLIFKDGFSTAEKIDVNAGRGQGMSIIKTIIKKHKGNLKVENKKDRQFKIIVKLP